MKMNAMIEACGRAGCTLSVWAAFAVAATANAEFKYFLPSTPIAIPASTTVGYYLNVTTGQFDEVGNVENPSIGWYGTFSGGLAMLHFGVPSGTTSGYEGARLNSPLNLAVGTYIGPTSSYFNGTGLGAAFHQDGTEIAGFKFTNPDTGVTNYGWIRVMTTSGGGYPAAIVDWGYDDSGAEVYAGLGQCPPDFNQDGFLDFFDFSDFVTAFENGDPRADYNKDGFVDFFDFSDYVDAFEAGC